MKLLLFTISHHRIMRHALHDTDYELNQLFHGNSHVKIQIYVKIFLGIRFSLYFVKTFL